MSMARCDDCENLIDTDADPEAIFETARWPLPAGWTPPTYVIRCQWCRERIGEAIEALAENAP